MPYKDTTKPFVNIICVIRKEIMLRTFKKSISDDASRPVAFKDSVAHVLCIQILLMDFSDESFKDIKSYFK